MTKNVIIVKIFKFFKIVQNCKKNQNCQALGQVMFPHHSDQMFQRSQVSRVTHCFWGSDSCTDKATLVGIELSQPQAGQLKIWKKLFSKIQISILIRRENIVIDINKEILQNIDIDKKLQRLEFGIANTPVSAFVCYIKDDQLCPLSLDPEETT